MLLVHAPASATTGVNVITLATGTLDVCLDEFIGLYVPPV